MDSARRPRIYNPLDLENTFRFGNVRSRMTGFFIASAIANKLLSFPIKQRAPATMLAASLKVGVSCQNSCPE